MLRARHRWQQRQYADHDGTTPTDANRRYANRYANRRYAYRRYACLHGARSGQSLPSRPASLELLHLPSTLRQQSTLRIIDEQRFVARNCSRLVTRGT
jgi:hypothetical protein